MGTKLKEADEPHALPPEAFLGRSPVRSADEPEKLLDCDLIEERLYGLARRALKLVAITLRRVAKILDNSLAEMRLALNLERLAERCLHATHVIHRQL